MRYQELNMLESRNGPVRHDEEYRLWEKQVEEVQDRPFTWRNE